MIAVKTLDAAEIKQVVFRLLGQIAPEADFDALSPNEDMREALEIDSFDFLNFLIALNKELGVEIPEKDYGRVNTLAQLTMYIQEHTR